jgi:hypothetical protein
MVYGTLSLNSRELEDGEVVNITELAPEGHGIAQDVEDILEADQVSSSVVDNEGLRVMTHSLCQKCVYLRTSRIQRNRWAFLRLVILPKYHLLNLCSYLLIRNI